MKKTWVKNTVCALVALAMVFGLWFAIGEKVANADITLGSVSFDTTPTPGVRTLQVGGTLDLLGAYTADPADQVTGAWAVKAGSQGNVTFSNETSTTATITGQTAGLVIVEYTVTNDNNAANTETVEINFTVTAPPPVMSVGVTSLTMTYGDAVHTPSVTNAPSGYSLTITGNTGVVELTNGDKSIRAVGQGTTTVKVTSTAYPSQTVDIAVTVNRKTVALVLTDPVGTTSGKPYNVIAGEIFTARMNANGHNGTLSWSNNGSTVAGIASTNTTSAPISSSAGNVGLVQFTVTAAETPQYTGASADFYIYFGVSATITVGSSKVSLGVNESKTVSASVTNGGDLKAYSSNENVASVIVGASGLEITGKNPGSAAITVGGTLTGSTKTIIVVVGNVKTATTLSFSPNVSTLAKGDSTVMSIHVDNPIVRSDGHYYAKITLGNRRVVVSDYNYSRVNDREYWVRLDSNGNATVTIKPQYNGSVKVTVAADDAAAVSRTFTVTGHPTLPQTGQNFTLIYVFGACCLVAVGTWVVLYARKKKNSRAA